LPGALGIVGDQPIIVYQLAKITTIATVDLAIVEKPDVVSVVSPQIVAIAIAKIGSTPSPEIGGHVIPESICGSRECIAESG
jgi:hypothetical protein